MQTINRRDINDTELHTQSAAGCAAQPPSAAKATAVAPNLDELVPQTRPPSLYKVAFLGRPTVPPSPPISIPSGDPYVGMYDTNEATCGNTAASVRITRG